MNKNKKLLDDFKKYCDQNPSQRFFQALSNWSGLQFIYAGKYPTDLEDTFFWETKNGSNDGKNGKKDKEEKTKKEV